ncbi:MAG: hypothetical protein ACI9N9_001167 [Enterobacterales bacterium]
MAHNLHQFCLNYYKVYFWRENMEFLQYVARPDVLGPLAGILAILGWVSISLTKRYYQHQERMQKLRQGIDPDLE